MTPGTIILSLAEMNEKALLDQKALANALGVDPRTIRRMVSRYELPPPVSFTGKSMWQAGKVLSYFEAMADKLSKKAEKEARKLYSPN